MNKRDLQLQRNNVAQLLRVSNRNRNVLKWSPNETIDHISQNLTTDNEETTSGKNLETSEDIW